MILQGCITSAKHNMTALVMPQPGLYELEDEEEKGRWVVKRHPVTGEVQRTWVDEPNTKYPDRGAYTITCQANAIITGGLNSQGTTERWTSKGVYENVDFLELRVPPNVTLRRRDRITNITDASGKIAWLEEDHPDENGEYPPTVFQVRGSAPSMDIFNRTIEHFNLLERAENQENYPSGGAS